MSEAAGTERQPRRRVFAVANQKGGVGKTTTAINLGTALAAADRRVLLVDLDPQGNASTGLGVERDADRPTVYELLLGQAEIAEVLRPSLVPGLDILPATVDLSAAELELAADPKRVWKLRDVLRSLPRPYDYVLIDCPPSLGLLTVNALVAADSVLVPLQCEFFALEGLGLLLRTIDRVRRSYNSRLHIHGVVLTMFDRRNNLSEQVAEDVRSFMGERVFHTVIPRNVRISEAPSHGKPVLLYDVRCSGARAYARLAGELLRRERHRGAA